MKILMPTCILIFLLVNFKKSCFAIEYENSLSSIDHNVDGKLEERNVPITMMQIRSLFRSQYNQMVALGKRLKALEDSQDDLTALTNKISTAETDLDDVEYNKKYIKDSISNNCRWLDNLVDSSNIDCCQTELVVVCLSRNVLEAYATAHDETWNSELDNSNCRTCPDGVEGYSGN